MRLISASSTFYPIQRSVPGKTRTMTDNDWKKIIRLVVTILAIAPATIPATLALGVAARVFPWVVGLL